MTDQRRTQSDNSPDLVDGKSQGERVASPATDEPWPDDPWADDEPAPAVPPALASFGGTSPFIPPRGSSRRISRPPSAPTPEHSRVAAMLRPPTARPPTARPPTAPSANPTRLARPASASTLRIDSMSEADDWTGRSPGSSSGGRIDYAAPPLVGPAVIEKRARPWSRMAAIVLGSLVTGGVGAFLVAKITQYGTTPEDTAPAVAAAALAPPPPPPFATTAPAATAADPRAAPATTVEPPVAPPPAMVTVAPPARIAAAPEDGKTADRGEPRPHPRASHATVAAAKLRLDSDGRAEPLKPEPRAERLADAARPEPAKPEAPGPELSPVKPPERETSEPPRAAPQDPPAAPRAGVIDVAATRAAVRSQIGPVQQCYERARMDDPSLAGTVTARITVAPDGSVARIEIVKSTLGAPQVEACIREGIARWHLPRPGGGAAASLTYPLVFQ